MIARSSTGFRRPIHATHRPTNDSPDGLGASRRTRIAPTNLEYRCRPFRTTRPTSTHSMTCSAKRSAWSGTPSASSSTTECCRRSARTTRRGASRHISFRSSRSSAFSARRSTATSARASEPSRTVSSSRSSSGVTRAYAASSRCKGRSRCRRFDSSARRRRRNDGCPRWRAARRSAASASPSRTSGRTRPD